MARVPKQCCPTCGQGVMERRVTLRQSMVRGLAAAHAAYAEGRLFILGELKRLYPAGNEYTHFYNLKYFGLVEKVLHPDGTEVPGAWRITNLGLWFLEDIEDVPAVVWVFNDQVMRTEGRIGITGVPAGHDTKDSVTQEWRATEGVG